MKRLGNLPAWPFCLAALILAVVLVLLISGCGESPPVRGSAQDDAVQKQARAATEREAADKAARDAAAADAQAMLDAETARRTAIPADIEKAAQSKAAAIVAEAVARAEEVTAAKAEAAAIAAQAAGRKERAAEAASEDDRAFAKTTRYIGLACVLIGAVIGIALARLVDGKTGAWIGGTVAGIGFLATAFGSTVTWLPVAAVAAVLVGLGAWALFHGREKEATAAAKDVGAKLSHLVDTVEGNTDATVAEAKQAVTAALNRGGLAAWIARLRAGWTTATAELAPVAPSQAPTVVITAEPKP